jgi:predicted enzyme related to lactoylglutathione lyase
MEVMTERPEISFLSVVLDAADHEGLARFWCDLLGWTVEYTDDTWVTVSEPGGTRKISFQQAPDHVPPTWPDNTIPQQLHIDLKVADLDAAEAHALSVGARKVPGDVHQPTFRVFLDPAGHTFCLCLE